MALDRAAAALEQAIEALDDAGATYRLQMLREAKFAQDGSVSNWLTRAADRDLIRQRDLDTLAKAADDLQSELHELTSLYSEVQTAILAGDGGDPPGALGAAGGPEHPDRARRQGRDDGDRRRPGPRLRPDAAGGTAAGSAATPRAGSSSSWR